MAKTLKDLTQQVIDFINERDWFQFHTPKDTASAISVEAAEVLEHFLWLPDKEQKQYLLEHKEEIGDELADVLYNLLCLAYESEVDIADAFERKMKKNAKKYPVEKSKGNHKKYNEL